MTTNKELKQSKNDIIKSLGKVGKRAFVYLEEGDGVIKMNGSFGNDNAINFIMGLIQERPDVKEHIVRLVNERDFKENK